MRIFYINDGEKTKFRHHKDIRMKEGVTFVVPEEITGCQEQVFDSSRLKLVVRFRFERLDINADHETVRVWYAPYPKNFFKLSIRLAEPYVRNLKEIMDQMSSAFLGLPKEYARGTILEDVPGNITSKRVSGMQSYIPEPSRLTQELAEFISDEENEKKPARHKSFDYWIFDQEMMDKGVLLNVGNEDGIEFMRYHEVGSLPEGKDIITAYVRPWFCEEYNL